MDPSIVTTVFRVRRYDLAETLRSGQAFRWREINGAWEGVVAGRWVRLRQSAGQEDVPHGTEAGGAGITAQALGGHFSGWNWLEDYLQLEVDIDAVISTFPRDEHMTRAVETCNGLRLLRQDPWECLASFILSSTKQIVQIQQIVELVCRRFGDPVPVPPDATAQWSFPSAARVSELSEAELRCCKMGFRAPYLRGSAKMVASGEVDLDRVKTLEVQQARAELLRLPGVGRKIADCVLLFAYGFQQAFPVDVWVLKALRQLYFPRRRPNAKKVRHFTETYFGPKAGYAQQYLFHYMRTRIGRTGGKP